MTDINRDNAAGGGALPVRYILSTLTAGSTKGDDLGVPDYSYRFVLEGYAPAVARLGEMVRARDRGEVEALAGAAAAAGQRSLFLCFTPPHRTPLDLPCPTVCVFAWEFGNFPTEQLDGDPRSDWRYVFARVAGVIALSGHAAGLVRGVMGSEVPVAAIFAPVAPRLFALPQRRPGEAAIVKLRGMVVDTNPLAVTARPAGKQKAEREPAKVQKFFASFFQKTSASLPSPTEVAAVETDAPQISVALRGIVYASVFNPMDGRKNWQDLMTGFCYAFRDQPNATLVMKMVHRHPEAFTVLLDILTRALAPFQCRVIALQGWMEDDEYDSLIAAADFYVNVSTGEGQCVPMMEFMAAGRPVVAPDHTAMADYVTETNGFVLRSNDEYNVWPHDPRDMFRTTRRRLEWESLRDGFQASYRVATEEPGRYRAMGDAARAAIGRCGARDVAEQKLAVISSRDFPHDRARGRRIRCRIGAGRAGFLGLQLLVRGAGFQAGAGAAGARHPGARSGA